MLIYLGFQLSPNPKEDAVRKFQQLVVVLSLPAIFGV
jgi:hypothetical protein